MGSDIEASAASNRRGLGKAAVAGAIAGGLLTVNYFLDYVSDRALGDPLSGFGGAFIAVIVLGLSTLIGVWLGIRRRTRRAGGQWLLAVVVAVLTCIIVASLGHQLL